MSVLDRLAGRMRNSIGRAVLRLVDDASRLQAVQVETQADVVRDSAEHFQHYGFTSHALPGAEGIALAVGGSTDHTVVINVDDRRYRLAGLQAGEVAIYDDQGQSVHLTRSGIVVRGAGLPVLITDTPLVTVDSDLHVTGKIDALGEITDLQQTGGKSMSHMRQVYNDHTHPENHDTTTSRPNQQV